VLLRPDHRDLGLIGLMQFVPSAALMLVSQQVCRPGPFVSA
jgi:hypothetical protein